MNKGSLMWLLVYPDGTLMTWRAKKPESRNYMKGTRCFQVIPTTTLKEVSDWVAENMPKPEWGFELKDW